MSSYISDVGTFQQREQVGAAGEYAQMKDDIAFGYRLDEYKERLRFYRDLAQHPVKFLTWRAIQTYESQSESKLINQLTVIQMYYDLQDSRMSQELEPLNPNALLLGYEYLNRLYTYNKDTFTVWVTNVTEFGANLSVTSKSKDEVSHTSATPVYFFDVLRYARYIVNHLHTSWAYLLETPPAITLLSTTKSKSIFCAKTYQNPLDSITETAQPSSDHFVQIIVDGQEFKLALYKYDTFATVRARISLMIGIPEQFIALKEEQVIAKETITTKSFGDTTITFKNMAWTFNPLEHKLLIFETLNYTIRKIILANLDGNVLSEISDYYTQLEKEKKVPIFRRPGVDTSFKMYKLALYELIKEANNKHKGLHLKYKSINDLLNTLRTIDQVPKVTGILEKIKTLGNQIKSQLSGDKTLEAFFGWNSKLEATKKFMEEQLKVFTKYIHDDATDTDIVKIEDLVQTNYRISGTFQLPRIDIFELFNQLTCTRMIPFARAGKFVKIVNNVIVFDEWLSFEHKEELCFYLHASTEDPVVETRNGKLHFAQEDDFVVCKVVEKEILADKTEFTFEIITTNESLENHILASFFSIFRKPPTDVIATRTFASGVTVIQQLDLCPFKLYDFALNNPFVKDTIRINERSNIYKLRRTYDAQEKTRDLSGTVSMKVLVSQRSLTYVDVTLKYGVPEGPRSPARLYFNADKDTIIWTVTISGELLTEQVTMLLRKLATALTIVKKDTSSFFYDWYCRNVIDIQAFDNKYTFSIPKTDRELFAAPELFVPGYERKCDAKPTAIKYDQTSYTLMKNADMKPFKYPSESPKYILTCPYPDKPYVNLIENTTLRNIKKFPWIPCCYTNPKNASYLYEAGNITMDQLKTYSTTADVGKTILSTLKQLVPGGMGKLPSRLNKLVNLLDQSKEQSALSGKWEYLRYGVGGPDELTAVTALEKATGITANWDELERLARSGLTQSTGLTPDVAVEILRERHHISPRSFMKVLRAYFKVEIILFLHDKVYNVEGTLGCEHYERTRIVNVREELYPTTVFLYVHRGSEFDNVPEPICDLITKSETSLDIGTKGRSGIPHFYTHSHICVTLRNMIDQMYPTQFIDVKIPAPQMIQNQQFDGFGITRGLQYFYGDSAQKLYIMYSGIPNVQASAQGQVGEPIETLIDIAEGKRLLPNSLVVVVPRGEMIAIGLYLEEGGVTKYLPVSPVPYVASMGPVFNTSRYSYPDAVSSYEKNFSDRYAAYLRLSNFVRSYLFWIYSYFLQSQDNTYDAVSQLPEWFNENVVMKPDTQYNSQWVKRLFQRSNTTILEDGKRLVIRGTAKECRNIRARLMYILRQALLFDQEYLIEFSNLQYIPNYYTSSNEFSTNVDYTVYNSPNEYKIMTDGVKAMYGIRYKFEDLKHSYFVMIDKRVYLAVPAESLGHAVAIAEWYADYRNIYPEDVLNVGEEDVTIYENIVDYGIGTTNDGGDEFYKVGKLEDKWFALIDQE